MHGAAPDTPVTIVENVSRSDQRVIPTTISTLPEALENFVVSGPAVLLYGLSPRDAISASLTLSEPAELQSEGAL